MTSKELERRLIREPVVLRASADGPPRVGGYALKFNKLSRNLGGWVEQIDPGSLRSSQGEGWPGVMARYNHEDLLGTTAAQSLRLVVDGTGLDYEVDLLADATSQRVHMLVERGDVTRSSFAAYMHESEWTQTPDGFPLRTVMTMTLVDVAPVDDPAYYDTSTGLRSLADQRGMDLIEVETLAREDRLNELLAKPPVVIDLGARGNNTVSDSEGVGETCAPGRLLAMRRALEIETAD